MKRKQLRFIGYCLVIGLIAALTMVGAACSSKSTTSTTAVLSTTSTTVAHTALSVDMASSGEEVALAVNDILTVTLDSNSASTGYQWNTNANISDRTVLRQTDNEYYPPTSSSVVGAPGQEVWTFKALKAGKSTISLEDRRSWEPTTIPPASTFTLTVIVQ
jgi:inhibitor of cysteine peptidase